MREEPKPCPFCGCGAEVQEMSGSYGYEPPKLRIACTQCFAATDWRKTEEWKQGVGTYSIEDKVRLHLVADWNRRASIPEKLESEEDAAFRVWRNQIREAGGKWKRNVEPAPFGAATKEPRAECERVWKEAMTPEEIRADAKTVLDDIRDMLSDPSIPDLKTALAFLLAARKRWEKAAANAKLEEIASMLENPSGLGHWMAEEIRALKQE